MGAVKYGFPSKWVVNTTPLSNLQVMFTCFSKTVTFVGSNIARHKEATGPILPQGHGGF